MTRRILILISGALLLFSTCAVFAQDDQAGPSNVTIHIRDYCDPATFNAVLGAGACDRSTATGAIPFAGFQAELGLDKSVGAWRFAPSQIRIAEGATLHVENLGGETHTFTEVKRFGGGFIAPLNTASGNLIPAPECAQVVNGNLVPQPPSDDNIFIPAGGSATVTEHEGVARYQCCIHPWMRLTITPRDQHHEQVQ